MLSSIENKEMANAAKIDETEPINSKNEHGLLTKSEIYYRLNKFMPNNVDSSYLKDFKAKLMAKHGDKFYKNNFKEFYDVYLPNKNFKKSSKVTNNENIPNFKLHTMKNSKEKKIVLPNLIDFIQVSEYNYNVNCLFAFADQSNGSDISYYKFDISQSLPNVS